VDTISELLNLKYNYVVLSEMTYMSYYPSVTIGPISIEKAKKFFNWKPSSLKFGIEESVKFFVSEGRNYIKEFGKMTKDLPTEIETFLNKKD
jgi:hypothetical protein